MEVKTLWEHEGEKAEKVEEEVCRITERCMAECGGEPAGIFPVIADEIATLRVSVDELKKHVKSLEQQWINR